MDPDIVNAPAYRDSINMALLQIPTISIVTDNAHLFDTTSGIYFNAIAQGSEWERPVSIELINPDSTEGFHINGGIRIRGGYSRHNENPKHSFRLFSETNMAMLSSTFLCLVKKEPILMIKLIYLQHRITLGVKKVQTRIILLKIWYLVIYMEK
ncbi:MAG: hypothetical protein IPO21_02710 [Bacteroidales bacterium]|nr:hypothetical protein [Bacteroidales bacterium]